MKTVTLSSTVCHDCRETLVFPVAGASVVGRQTFKWQNKTQWSDTHDPVKQEHISYGHDATNKKEGLENGMPLMDRRRRLWKVVATGALDSRSNPCLVIYSHTVQKQQDLTIYCHIMQSEVSGEGTHLQGHPFAGAHFGDSSTSVRRRRAFTHRRVNFEMIYRRINVLLHRLM